MRKMVFMSSPGLWVQGHGEGHPLKPERLMRTVALLEAYGALDAPNVQVVAPRLATIDELALFHTPDYIDAVHSLSAGERRVSANNYGFASGDNPIFDGMFETESLKAGSSLQAAQLLMAGACDVAFSFGGGLHHAMPGYASGFCVFNDAAVAIQWLVNAGARVAYVDVDAHHGDGVQTGFYKSNQVLTISLHQDGRTLFPGTGFVNEIGIGLGEGYSVNVPLAPSTDDETYLWAFDQIVPPLLDRFSADIVVTQLGVDTHFLDPLTHLMLTTAGQKAIYERLAHYAPRWLALGGGGYAIDVVPRSWSIAFGVMASLSLPDKLPDAYRQRFGGEWLEDKRGPMIDQATRDYVHRHTEKVVDAVKKIHLISSIPR
ncbi:MAG: acetoin utilization protein AcuC [Anaerolineae bacterium]|nr:acetoin utilization protein AcuC [Anaerolineae bacterium]